MGKRVEKLLHAKQADELTTEPYTCIGVFAIDFQELCREAELKLPPPVVSKLKLQLVCSAAPAAGNSEKQSRGRKEDKRQQIPAEVDQQVDKYGDPLPTTFNLNSNQQVLKPKVLIETEILDKEEVLTGISIRGWLLDDIMLGILRKSTQKIETLHTLSLWQVGLSAESIETLAYWLSEFPSIKNLAVEGNAIPGQNYHLLVTAESRLQSLSLRFNQIDDAGALSLSKALASNSEGAVPRLQILNLSSNRISGMGAAYMAEALRSNRTLVSLNLSCNQIDDDGGACLAQILQPFPFRHEEILIRRRLLPLTTTELGESGEHQVKASRERPTSTTPVTSRLSRKSRKEGKKEEEKAEKSKTKKEEKLKRTTLAASDGKLASKKTGKKNKVLQPEVEVINTASVQSGFLDPAQDANAGEIVIPGNLRLLNLNLSHNNLTEFSVQKLTNAVRIQQSLRSESQPGLIRLNLQHNHFALKTGDFLDLQAILMGRQLSSST